MPEFATIHSAGASAVTESPAARVPDLEWDDEDVIDGVLRLVADHHRAVGAAIDADRSRQAWPSSGSVRWVRTFAPSRQPRLVISIASMFVKPPRGLLTCCSARSQARRLSFRSGFGAQRSGES